MKKFFLIFCASISFQNAFASYTIPLKIIGVNSAALCIGYATQYALNGAIDRYKNWSQSNTTVNSAFCFCVSLAVPFALGKIMRNLPITPQSRLLKGMWISSFAKLGMLIADTLYENKRLVTTS